MTKPHSQWVNAQTQPVTRFGADPNNPGRSIVRAWWATLNGFKVPVVGGGRWGSRSFHGAIVPQLQNPTAAVARIGTPNVYRTGPANNINSGAGAGVTGDPVRRILAERLANGVGL